MRSADDGLRALFSGNLKRAQWTPIETGATAAGVPDSEFCFPGGIQGWIEHKSTGANAIKFRPMQPGWIDRRVRLGGRVFVAVKRRKELFMFHGRDVKKLATEGIKGANPLGYWVMPWNWEEIEEILCVGF